MKISVAICTYNGEKYIQQQLKSILDQTYVPNEIVICDDGSTDNTVEIITEYLKTTTIDIKICKNTSRLNVLKNFEKAIQLCSGEIIFLSDQDDCWYSDKIERIVKYFKENQKIKVVFTNAQLIDDKDFCFTDKTLFDVVNFTDEAQKLFKSGFELELLNIDNRVTGASLAFKKDFIVNIVPFIQTTEILHDEIIAISAINNKCLGFINDCLFNYRIHNTQKNGLGDWLSQPPSIDVFKCVSIKPAYRQVKYNNEILSRINFIEKRKQIIKSAMGLIIPFVLIRQYKRIYSYYTFSIIRSDVVDFVNLNISRLKKYLIHA